MEEEHTEEETKTTKPTPPTSEEIAKSLIDRMKLGKGLLDQCEKEILDTVKVRGKTLREWNSFLKVEIPADSSDIRKLEKACAQVAHNLQEAEGILATFEVKQSITSNFHDSGFARKYVEEMRNPSNKKIAAEKLRQLVMVDSELDMVLSASQTARLVTDYFKRIVKGLEETRKGLENMARLVGLRLRYLQD